MILQRLPRASPVLHIEENTLNAPLLDVQQKATMKEYQSKRKIQFRNQKDIIEEKDWKFNVGVVGVVILGVVTYFFSRVNVYQWKWIFRWFEVPFKSQTVQSHWFVNNKQGQELINLGFILYKGVLSLEFVYWGLRILWVPFQCCVKPWKRIKISLNDS